MTDFERLLAGKLSRRRLLTGSTTVGVGVAGLSLVGCGDDDDDAPAATSTSAPDDPTSGSGDPDPTATQPAADPTATPDAGGPKTGGTLIVEASNPVPTALFGAGNPANYFIQRTVWETLIRVGEDFLPTARLAESFEFINDFNGAILKLPPGVEFHNGKPMTATVIEESIEMHRSDEITSQLKNPLKEITEINVADELKIELTFAGRRPALMDTFARLPMVDVDNFTRVSEATPDVVVGTGPFKLTEFVPDQSYRLERFDNYRLPGQPYIDALDGKIFADIEARALAIQTGDIMFTNQTSYKMVSDLSDNDDVKFTDLGMSGLYYIGLIVDASPLEDVRLRQAIMLGIDRKRIAEEWGEGVVSPTTLPWVPGSPGAIAEDAALGEYDPDAARALIAEAGLEGTKLRFTIGNRSPRPGISQFMQADLKDIGIDVELNIVEYSVYLADLRGRSLPDHGWVSLHGFSDAMHPATLLNSAQQYRIPNPGHYESDEFADLIARMNEIDPGTEEGVAVLSEFNKRYVWEDPWLIPLAPRNIFWAMRENVMGAVKVGGQIHRSEDWWIA